MKLKEKKKEADAHHEDLPEASGWRSQNGVNTGLQAPTSGTIDQEQYSASKCPGTEFV